MTLKRAKRQVERQNGNHLTAALAASIAAELKRRVQFIRSAHLVPASLFAGMALLPGEAIGQNGSDGTYVGRVTASGRCGFDSTDMSVTVQGPAVRGFIVTPRGLTLFLGDLSGEKFTIKTTDASGNQVVVEGVFAPDGSKIDAVASGGSCVVRGALPKNR